MAPFAVVQRLSAAVAAAALFSGCASNSSWSAPLGSRADAPLNYSAAANFCLRPFTANDPSVPTYEASQTAPAPRLVYSPTEPPRSGDWDRSREALVIFDLVVDERGMARNIRIISSPPWFGPGACIELANEVSMWRFAPGRVGNYYVRTHLLLPVTIEAEHPIRDSVPLSLF